MRFYQPDYRRGPVPPLYRQRFGPPNQMTRQAEPYFYPNQFRRPGNPNFYAEQFRGQYYHPNQNTGQNLPFSNTAEQQPRFSRLAKLPDHFNTLMGHAGTVQNGINMMRQLGSFLGRFR